MKKTHNFLFLLAILLSVPLLPSAGCKGQGNAKSASHEATAIEPAKKQETSESVQKNVDSTMQQEIWKKRSDLCSISKCFILKGIP